MNIPQKLKTWQEKGLITPYQATRIGEFENANSGARLRFYLYYGLVSLALFLIGLGVISLVAANWAQIPNHVKLGADFALLTLVALGTFEAYNRHKNALFEALLILFELLLFASLGLIGQVFQLSPDALSGLWLWSVLSLPLWFFVKNKLIPLLGIPIFVFALYNYVYTQDKLLVLWEKASLSWTASMPILLSFTAILLQRVLKRLAPRKGFYRALNFWLAVSLSILIYGLDRGYQLEPRLGLQNAAFSYTLTFAGLFSVAVALILIVMLLSKKQKMWPALMLIILIGSVVHLPLILSLAALAVFGASAYQNNRPQWFNVALLLAALRLFLFYCQIFNGLAQTAFGLITAGAVLIFLLEMCRLAAARWRKNEK